MTTGNKTHMKSRRHPHEETTWLNPYLDTDGMTSAVKSPVILRSWCKCSRPTRAQVLVQMRGHTREFAEAMDGAVTLVRAFGACGQAKYGRG